jgi:hypothetical protein
MIIHDGTELDTSPFVRAHSFEREVVARLTYMAESEFLSSQDSDKIIADMVEATTSAAALLVPPEAREVLRQFSANRNASLGYMFNSFVNGFAATRISGSTCAIAEERLPKEVKNILYVLSTDSTGIVKADAQALYERINKAQSGVTARVSSFLAGRGKFSGISRAKLDKAFPEFKGAFGRGLTKRGE